ncbi:hypothetical protein F0L74_29530 [Chitinophaga agrisoli]|uniref:Uncharacterized protein n=1 Tax=Chitinophaga agrisoli TaxID=2607653 RepID=A0A5B2VPH5_9BACT|nr:hypothetical protein [Chitinophaga agrisoli]KAA2240306.1 hypothetical protein F0L74_29530 [Chitinophaga agrisoli]
MPAHTNYIRHLNAFFAQGRQDKRLHANHISLYVSLFQIWNEHRFQNPFPILREEVIDLCHIGSVNTYTQCLKDLNSFGYILYQPGPKRGTPSLISIRHLDSEPEKKINTAQLSLFPGIFLETPFSSFSHAIIRPPIIAHPSFKKATAAGRKNETATNLRIETASCKIDTATCLKIATINRKIDTTTNLKIETASRKIDTDTNLNFETGSVSKLRLYNNKQTNSNKRESVNKRSRAEKIKDSEHENHRYKQTTGPAAPPAGPPPAQDQVLLFFQDTGYPDVEARKFFHHYQANGWRQGNGNPITDWQAAGHKWMLNEKFLKQDNHDTKRTANKPGRLHANEDKSYEDPL